jgi:O-6-methylguanine DNA methyltransferase
MSNSAETLRSGNPTFSLKLRIVSPKVSLEFIENIFWTIFSKIYFLTLKIKGGKQKQFDRTLQDFKTSVQLLGSPFQKLVWNELVSIPYGQTRSYLEQAIKKQAAYRAVANANGANQIAIVIPCHRIINSNGKLGGYSGGISRKKWLIEHEKQHQSPYNTANKIDFT